MSDTATAVKTCTGCGQTKPLDAFRKDTRNRDGRGAICKTCDATSALARQRAAEYATLRYDYGAIDDRHRQLVQDAALDILAHGRRAKDSIVAMGQRLIEVKAILPEWTFTAWLKTEFELSERMAQNLMNVAREYGERPEIISVLSDTVLYLLAAPSTPDAARAEVEAIAVTEGKSPKVARAKRIVKAHKEPRQFEAGMAEVERAMNYDPRQDWGDVVAPTPVQLEPVIMTHPPAPAGRTVTLTLDRALAQKLHAAVLIRALRYQMSWAEQEQILAALQSALEA